MKSLRLKTGGMRFTDLVQKGQAQYEKELFLWVFSSTALYATDPNQELINKCPDAAKRAEVLLSWFRKGHIIGAASNWSFSPELLRTVMQNLKFRQSSLGSFGQKNEEQVELYTLVSEFRKGLKAKKVPPFPRIAAELRFHCRMYEPKEVLRLIRAFFKKHGAPESYSMARFSAYVTFHGRKR